MNTTLLCRLASGLVVTGALATLATAQVKVDKALPKYVATTGDEEEVFAVLHDAQRRIRRVLKCRGLLPSPGEDPPLPAQSGESLLPFLQAASIQSRIEVGRKAEPMGSGFRLATEPEGMRVSLLRISYRTFSASANRAASSGSWIPEKLKAIRAA